jgi:hypothetical protein
MPIIAVFCDECQFRSQSRASRCGSLIRASYNDGVLEFPVDKDLRASRSKSRSTNQAITARIERRAGLSLSRRFII